MPKVLLWQYERCQSSLEKLKENQIPGEVLEQLKNLIGKKYSKKDRQFKKNREN